MKLEFSSFGTKKNGHTIYLKLFSQTAGVRVQEMEESCKYRYNIHLHIFDFSDEGYYNLLKKIRLDDAFEEIPEIKEFIRIYYKEVYELLSKKKDEKYKEEKSDDRIYI